MYIIFSHIFHAFWKPKLVKCLNQIFQILPQAFNVLDVLMIFYLPRLVAVWEFSSLALLHLMWVLCRCVVKLVLVMFQIKFILLFPLKIFDQLQRWKINIYCVTAGRCECSASNWQTEILLGVVHKANKLCFSYFGVVRKLVMIWVTYIWSLANASIHCLSRTVREPFKSLVLWIAGLLFSNEFEHEGDYSPLCSGVILHFWNLYLYSPYMPSRHAYHYTTSWHFLGSFIFLNWEEFAL
jgi:hypothetical protein